MSRRAEGTGGHSPIKRRRGQASEQIPSEALGIWRAIGPLCHHWVLPPACHLTLGHGLMPMNIMGHVPGLMPALTGHECVLGSVLVWSLFWPSACPAMAGPWAPPFGGFHAWEGGKCVSKRQNIKDPMCVCFKKTPKIQFIYCQSHHFEMMVQWFLGYP